MTTVYINNTGFIGEMANISLHGWKRFAKVHKQSHMYKCYAMDDDKRTNYNIFSNHRWNKAGHENFKIKGFKGIREYYVGDKYDNDTICNKNEYVIQIVVGDIEIGNVGLTHELERDGYVVTLCTMDKDERFVDLLLTKKQVIELGQSLENEFRRVV